MPKKYDYDWNTLLQEQQHSGMNMKKFCMVNNLPYSSFRNHKHALQEHEIPLRLVPVEVDHPKTIKLSVNETELSLDASIDDVSLRRILKALSS